MSSGPPLLSAFLNDTLAGNPDYEGLAAVIGAIAHGAIQVEAGTRRAALAGVLGYTDETNVQGEIVARLDTLGTETFVQVLRDCGQVAALACEELEEMVHISNAPGHPFLAVFDPVDGSSNIDVAITIGSIFGIYRRADDADVTEQTFLRPGREQIAATYVIYGSSTVLVFAVEAGVHGFTLDPETREFVLTHEDIRIPEKCSYYSVNEGNAKRWDAGVTRAVSMLREKYSQRYVGSLVADFHRDLLKGGIFLYPGDEKSPSGKLRLSYEANPLSYVAEQAGGAGSTGTGRIMDVVPEALHQRTPLVIGNAAEVAAVEAAIAG
ncbi:MAG TPA: class 1 fructose-bisphosphatase [Dehalococcoidia bacterium]|nr:class 1 fructose-bisphosphatase [Dehalococcoidia bacterium]